MNMTTRMLSSLLKSLFFFLSFHASASEVLILKEDRSRKPATTHHHYPTTHHYSPPPEISDKSRNKYYDFSISGISDYLDDLEKDDPKARQELQADFEKLETKWKNAKILMWSSAGVGVGIVTYSLVTKSTLNAIPGILAGVGVGLIGPIIGAIFIGPSNSEIRKFVNKNNDIAPNHQLELKNLSLNIDPVKGSEVAVTLSF